MSGSAIRMGSGPDSASEKARQTSDQLATSTVPMVWKRAPSGIWASNSVPGGRRVSSTASTRVVAMVGSPQKAATAV